MDRETEKRLIISQQRSYKIFKGNEIIQKARYDLNITELNNNKELFSLIDINEE
jgi:hypothetical protein